nr:hypothetical protein [Candidatus Kapabacteria bacterium]
FEETDPYFVASDAFDITWSDKTNWNNAFNWGNHAEAGYLTSYEETDPIFSNSVAFNILDVDILNWNDAYNFGAIAYSWGNHAGAGYLHDTDPYVQSLNSLTGELNIVAGTNITVQESDNNIIISSTGGGGGITFPYLGYPNCETDAFTIMNSGTGGCVVGLSSNNNVGRLGTSNYGVVGVDGAIGNLGALGTYTSGVKALSYNGIVTKLADQGLFGLTSDNPNTGISVNLAGNAGLYTTNSLFSNSGAYVGYSFINEYYGFWSDNYTNGIEDATQVVLTGSDFVLHGYNGNTRNIYLATETEGLLTSHFPPGSYTDDCSVKLTPDDPVNPGYAFPLQIYKKIDANNSWTVESGRSSALYAYHFSTLTGYTSATFCQYAGLAATFNGNVDVVGNLSKLGGSFKIDHPQDPENKYLVHSFVESPDMKNIYDGVVILDENGEAVVDLPDYFEALNKDFRYQLTCIGGFANVYISDEIHNNKFKIAGGKAGLKISWLVTGIRKDPWAEKNRIQTEVEKSDKDKGKYLTPDVYNQPKEKGIYFESNNLQLK